MSFSVQQFDLISVKPAHVEMQPLTPEAQSQTLIACLTPVGKMQISHKDRALEPT